MNRTVTTSVFPRTCRGSAMLAGILTIAVLLAGCGIGSSTTSRLAENQQILSTCDATHPPAAWVGIDGTGSSASSSILTERLNALQSIVQETAVCSGYLKVTVFSASSVASTTLYDASLRQPGATTNARLQRVPKAVDTVMATVRSSYKAAVKHLSPNGSDITGQYEEAAEWFRQLGGSYDLHLALLTDGFQHVSIGVDLGAHPLSQHAATVLAQQVPVPNLPGAMVTVAGLGRVANATPSTPIVNGLVAYYNALCHRMNAATCTAVSDYQAAGW